MANRLSIQIKKEIINLFISSQCSIDELSNKFKFKGLDSFHGIFLAINKFHNVLIRVLKLVYVSPGTLTCTFRVLLQSTCNFKFSMKVERFCLTNVSYPELYINFTYSPLYFQNTL